MMELLKHVNNEDVALEILSKYYIKEKDEYSLKVRWWNVGRCHEPWCMWLTERIRVSKQDMKKWRPYTYEPSKPARIKQAM